MSHGWGVTGKYIEEEGNIELGMSRRVYLRLHKTRFYNNNCTVFPNWHLASLGSLDSSVVPVMVHMLFSPFLGV
eukprot:1161127-Pelagomonas_calceolata.AAC.6